MEMLVRDFVRTSRGSENLEGIKSKDNGEWQGLWAEMEQETKLAGITLKEASKYKHEMVGHLRGLVMEERQSQINEGRSYTNSSVDLEKASSKRGPQYASPSSSSHFPSANEFKADPEITRIEKLINQSKHREKERARKREKQMRRTELTEVITKSKEEKNSALAGEQEQKIAQIQARKDLLLRRRNNRNANQVEKELVDLDVERLKIKAQYLRDEERQTKGRRPSPSAQSRGQQPFASQRVLQSGSVEIDPRLDIVDELAKMFDNIFDVDEDVTFDPDTSRPPAFFELYARDEDVQTLESSLHISPPSTSSSSPHPLEAPPRPPRSPPSARIRTAAKVLNICLNNLAAAEEAGDQDFAHTLQSRDIPNAVSELESFGVPVRQCDNCSLPIRGVYYECPACPVRRIVCNGPDCYIWKACRKWDPSHIPREVRGEVEGEEGMRWMNYL
ncbi:MAG: hypothetical protein Q9227_005055 [Pyrenula ochraceoflavens]